MGHLLFSLLTVLLLVRSGQGASLRDFYASLFKQTSEASLPSQEELFQQVDETAVRTMAASSLRETLPFAVQCLHSSLLAIRRDGQFLLLAVGLRDDSASLLEPYRGDLQTIILNKADPLRESATYILASENPGVPQKGVEFFLAHFRDGDISLTQRKAMAGGILRSTTRDVDIDKVVSSVMADSDASARNLVLRQLGLVSKRTAVANQFISDSLKSAEPETCRAALDAIERMDQPSQMPFLTQLEDVAARSKQTEIKAQAEAILHKIGTH